MDQQLNVRRLSMTAQEKIPKLASPPKAMARTLEIDTAELMSPQPQSNINSAVRDSCNSSPTKLSSTVLETLESLEDFSKLIMDCEVNAQTAGRKMTNSARFLGILSDIKAGYPSIQEELGNILRNSASAPLSPDSSTILKQLKASFAELYKNAMILNQYLAKLTSKSFNLSFTSTRRQKIIDYAGDIQRSWVTLNVNLTLFLARRSNDTAKGASSNVAKLAIATGAPAWDEINEKDAHSIFLQGEKFLMGFGVPQDFGLAFQRYKTSADAGMADACHMIGTMFELGLGREKNLSEAIDWYKKGASLGSVDSHNALGRIFEQGQHMPLDIQRAIKHYKTAAVLGNVDAVVNLGHLLEKLYTHTEEEEHLLGKAFKWYTKAAEKGYARAQNALGSAYYRGKGTEQCFELAVNYFRMSADQNNAHACNNLGVCYEEGHGVPKDLGVAKEFYRRAAEMFHPSGLSNYGFILLLERDYKTAVKQFLLAYSLGSSDAAYHLGTLYEGAYSEVHESIVHKDLHTALMYYEDATNKGHIKASLRAGAIYLLGPEEIQDALKAVKYIHIAASCGNDPDAFNLIGQMYQLENLRCKDILGTDDILEFTGFPSHLEALKYYDKAIKLGHVGALYNAALLYETGSGVQLNIPKAVKMYEQATRMGYSAAGERLQELRDVHII